MDNDNTNDDLNNVYMNMLNRNIPGVGNNPITPSTTTTTTTAPAATATTTHLTNKNTANTLMNTAGTGGSLTQKQRHAIDALTASLKDALFISEGEEPFQTVHISIGTSGTTPATMDTTTASVTTFPTEQEFRTLLHTTHLLPSFQSQHQQQEAQDGDDDNDDDQDVCERSSDLGSILAKSNPGSDKIAQALHTHFEYPSSSSATTATKNDKVVLYRIADPVSSTRVHIWVLGWIDGDLIGLHTISIES